MLRNLEEFQMPNDGEISLCEINGLMHFMNHEYANVNAFTTTVESHPKIHITRETLHPVSSGDEGKALFLPVDVPFLKQLSQVYYEQGLVEALHTAEDHQQVVLAKTAGFLLSSLHFLRKIRLMFNPKVKSSAVAILQETSQTRNWLNNSIRCLVWHPYCTKLALVTSDDSVRIFAAESSYCPILRCKQQKNVSCVSWRPNSLTELAVGHENGIIIWNVDPSSLVARPSVSNASILYRLEHSPVVHLTWTLRGDLLITAAACDSSLLVWDVEFDRISPLKRPGGSGNLLVKMSPSGDKMFSASNGLVFRVWDCKNWECERWTILSGRIQSACWSNCGNNLLFTTTTEPIIYGVTIKTDKIFTSDQESSSNKATQLFDVTKVDIDGVLVGGLVQSMETDPKGRHLAVMFQDTNCIALFNIVRQSGIQIIPSSLVVGLPEEQPSCICFQQNFKAGACLTVSWSSGRIQYYPIVYTDLTGVPENSRLEEEYQGSLHNTIF